MRGIGRERREDPGHKQKQARVVLDRAKRKAREIDKECERKREGQKKFLNCG